MLFKVKTTGNIYSNKTDIEKLKNIGFTFKLITNDNYFKNSYFINGNVHIEINTLDQLINFQSEFGEIIIGNDYIEIYNDYRE